MSNSSESVIISHTKAWIRSFVIGLQLCPFASRPFQDDRIKYVVSFVPDVEELTRVVMEEGKLLIDSPPEKVETTLIIHPSVLTDFTDFIQYTEIVESFFPQMGWQGILQLAHFHPNYYFHGTSPQDISNYTNRSPYPILHLLRENSVSEAINAHPDIHSIPEQNISKIESLGLAYIKALHSQWGSE